ncbi:MAG TPA: hypothetical protein VJA82_12680 [Sediminibacterium sp.]|uniref:nucleoid-associated protein n=1 Tax=Sediminibacterium sp. TaxID=1917865 RepID=UPI0008D10074|nr:nucleoid-associated protein [Sediminibacterium sp.]OHC86423.1 MAG: hypothetical protein A2472_02300 [Sphingobacteriia bacterium RIFOXYC2_FULL_35_18]OHC89935.1 MAG: hypothetical protein A2546_11550 [Sphingobacteriia bacterium RIFOXYD2_FULL_35_12]HLD54156.1 hypothetical protein [Sediminibacterium sp.]
MNAISGVIINKLMVHQAGNAAQGSSLILSETAHEIPDEFWQQTLTHFFLKPFNEAEQYQLNQENNLVYDTIVQVFEGDITFETGSKKLAEHFHVKSQSVFAKSGEFYMVFFENIPFDDGFTDAIGLFHTSTKDQFLKVKTQPAGINLSIEDGIDLKKPEKGVILLRKEQNQGFLALIHESTASKQGDAAFWKSAFLQAAPIINSYHNTNETLGMCKLFISNELTEHFDTNKTDQIDMLQRSMDYFKTHDQFQIDEFSKEVLYHPEVIDSFTQYKQQYEVAKQVNIEDEFAINPAAIQKQQRHFKSILKLDKNFHVYVHGRRDLIEKGYDEMTGKHYYKLYFDQEQ